MELLIATKNKFKIAEMMWYLEGVKGVNIHYLEELGCDPKVEEDCQTLLDNAEKKARKISELTEWFVLCSDRGVDIPGLKDRWDILRNQRIIGEGKNDREKVDTLLDLMEGLKGQERMAEDHFALALAQGGRILWSGQVVADQAYIAEEVGVEDIPQSTWMGFLLYYPKFKKRYTQLNLEEKEEVRSQQLPLKVQFQDQIRRT